jgi:HSP20 family protein
MKDAPSPMREFVVSDRTIADNSRKRVPVVPPIEAWVHKQENQYHLSVALPDVDPKEIQLNLEGNNLIISGEYRTGEKANTEYLRNEFAEGAFERRLTLPKGIELDKLAARYGQGVLEIVAPMSGSAIPRRIGIKDSSPREGQGGK